MKKNQVELSLYDTSIFLEDDCFDIADDVFDYVVAFGVPYDTQDGDDYMDKVLEFMARCIVCFNAGKDYKLCRISEFMNSYRKQFDEWMNEHYFDEYKPKNNPTYTIDDEEFFDVYIDLFDLIVCGVLTDKEYKGLYEILTKNEN